MGAFASYERNCFKAKARSRKPLKIWAQVTVESRFPPHCFRLAVQYSSHYQKYFMTLILHNFQGFIKMMPTANTLLPTGGDVPEKKFWIGEFQLRRLWLR
jgi:hypothetical protein